MKTVGRNDRCPCGSGRKFKQCCLQGAGKATGNWISIDAATTVPIPQAIRIARDYYVAGHLFQAESICRKVLLAEPNQPDAFNLLGLMANQVGNSALAADLIGRAIHVDPAKPEYHFNLGCTFEELNRPDAAAASYRTALTIMPRYLEALVNLGSILKNQGEYDAAVDCYRTALTIRPHFAEIQMNLGNVFKALGSIDDAIICYRKALALKPDLASAHYNLGSALADIGKLDESLASLRKSLELKPDFPDALRALGQTLHLQGKAEEDMASYRQALAIDPDFAQLHSDLLLVMHYATSQSAEDIHAASIAFGQRFAEPLSNGWCRRDVRIEPGARLKVGFVSGDLRCHPVGFFLENVLRHLDQGSFALYAYANQTAHDALSERIRPCFDKWVEVRGLSDEQLAARIHDDGIDLLIDLAGHTDGGGRLLTFARKPAPVQVSWLGYANSTGLRAMDYILADPITLPPDEERFYTEKVWRLPDTYLCFTPPDVAVAVNPLPAATNGYVTFGCFNKPTKINERVIACWAKILLALPDSVLLLKHKTFDHEQERESFCQRFQQQGIVPDRLRFEGESSRAEYLAAYDRIDCSLDPFPFPGATTTCEALWMGVPTLTLAMARGMYGHNGELLMKTVGLSDWVAYTEEEYLAKAQALCLDLYRLAELRSGLRQRMLQSSLCNARRFARHLEDAFRGMVAAAAA